MRNLREMMNVVFILQILVWGCGNKPMNQNSGNSVDTIKKETIEVQSSDANTIDQSTLSPYKDVDSLVRLLAINNFAFSDVKKLERICSVSDGELGEYLDVVAVALFNDHLKRFLEYLQSNPKSCLKNYLITGIGANYSVYEKSERPELLLQEQDRLILIAEREKLDKRKIKLIREIYKEVDPNLLD
jgi:hypothetical protein